MHLSKPVMCRQTGAIVVNIRITDEARDRSSDQVQRWAESILRSEPVQSLSQSVRGSGSAGRRRALQKFAGDRPWPGDRLLKSAVDAPRTAVHLAAMEDPQVHVVTTMQTRPASHGEFAEAMRTLVRAGRGIPGNIRFEAYQGIEDPRDFVVIEVWADEDAADTHLGSDHTDQAFAAIGPLLELPSAIVRHVRIA